MELSVATITCIITFIIWISFISYRKIEYIQTIISQKSENLKYLILTLTTLSVPFFVYLTLDLFSQNAHEKISLISNIAGITTPFIALIAYLEYRSKVANKVNEKQLDKVLELLNQLRDTNLELFVQYSNNPMGHEDNITILSVAKKYKKNQNNIDLYILAFPYKNSNTVKSLSKIANYKTDFLIPQKIAKQLEPFTLNISEIQSKNYRLATDGRDIYPPIKIRPGRSGYISNKSLVVIGLSKLVDHVDHYESVYDPERGYPSNPPIITAISMLNGNANSAYSSWFDFEKSCFHLILSIKEWLEKNNVKDVNLPDLDQTNTTSKDT